MKLWFLVEFSKSIFLLIKSVHDEISPRKGAYYMMTLNDILKIIVGFLFPLVIIIYCNAAIVHFVITAMKVTLSIFITYEYLCIYVN